MAHELDYNEKTGQKSVFAVGESMWHNEGHLLTSAPTLEKAKELAGVNYEAIGKQLYVKCGTEFIKCPIGKAIVRTDRFNLDRNAEEAILGVVGRKYEPLQNADAFDVLGPLLDSGVAFLETGGTLRGGQDAWMLVRFDIKNPVVQEVFTNEIIPFGLFQNNFSGRIRASISQTPIRVVCANTLAVAERYRTVNIGVKHRKNVKFNYVTAAEKFLERITDRYTHIAEQYKIMKERIMTMEEFTESVLDVVSPYPEDKYLKHGIVSKIWHKADDRRNRITELWDSGKGHIGDHSAWEAFNGTVQALDHDSELFKVKGSRLSAMIDGPLSEKKEAVLNSLNELCLVRR